jgi:hypothetical protein
MSKPSTNKRKIVTLSTKPDKTAKKEVIYNCYICHQQSTTKCINCKGYICTKCYKVDQDGEKICGKCKQCDECGGYDPDYYKFHRAKKIICDDCALLSNRREEICDECGNSCTRHVTFDSAEVTICDDCIKKTDPYNHSDSEDTTS